MEFINYSMNSLEHKDQENPKISSGKSICRMVALNQQIPDIIKEQQIDQVRKKLRQMCKVKNKKNNNCEQQYQTDKKYINSKMMTILFKQSKLNKNLLPVIKENKKFKHFTNKQQSAQFNHPQLSHRKVKTQIQQIIHGKENMKAKKKNQNYRIKRISKQNLIKIDFPICFQNKTEKICIHKKFWNRFAINQGLNDLKQNRNQVPNIFSKTVYQKQKNALIQTDFPTNRTTNSVKDANQNIKQTKASMIFSNSKLKNEIATRSYQSKSNSKQINYKQISQKNKLIQLTNKTQSYKSFVNFICLSNRLLSSDFGPYKFYIIKGNNDELPRRLLKKRKWIQSFKIQDANLVWSQKREQNFMNLFTKPFIKQQKIQITKKHQIFLEYECFCIKKHKQNQICFFLKLLPANQEQNQNKAYLLYKNEKMKSNIISFKNANLFKLEQKDGQKIRIHNHLKYHQQIAYKKLLFLNLKQYYESKDKNPFQYIPITFHIQSIKGQQWQNFVKCYREKIDQKQVWIIKPGENTNRGTGIKVQSELSNIRQQVSEILCKSEDNKRSVIVQRYIMPLLYNKRKFDIRCYMMVTVVNNKLKVYWYEEGYIRTSCKQFSIDNIQNKFIHLTNDAVQKVNSEYGKHEPGNKLSFQTLANYIQKTNPSINFYNDIYPRFVALARDAVSATYDKLHEYDKYFAFEIFGLDFMIDEHYKTWLIQVNRNPCLETSTSLLARIINHMMDNAFRIAIDPLFPMADPVYQALNNSGKDFFQQNKFTLIFDKHLSQNYEILKHSQVHSSQSQVD